MSQRTRESKDRRRSDRHSAKIPVDYSAVDSFFTEFCSNINDGGLFVETENPPPTDTVVQLQIRLPELDEPLTLEARVAWVSDGKADAPSGMGVEFIGMDSAARETINEVVRRLRAAR